MKLWFLKHQFKSQKFYTKKSTQKKCRKIWQIKFFSYTWNCQTRLHAQKISYLVIQVRIYLQYDECAETRIQKCGACNHTAFCLFTYA